VNEVEKVPSPDGSLQFIALSANTLVAGSDDLNYAQVLERKVFGIPTNAAQLVRKVFNSGSTIPLDIQVVGEDQRPLGAPESQAMAAACEVQVSFSGDPRAPGCARYDPEQNTFHFHVKTSKSLAPGSYGIAIRVLQDGVLLSEESLTVRIR
jgi:hypothetical protein